MVKMATCDINVIQNALGIQQIGPRTVIVPADPIIWDEGTSYEYLTLVASTDFGQGYVSKKDVPAGTQLTNTDYWIPVASFNAQLAAIQKAIASINGSIAELESFKDSNKIVSIEDYGCSVDNDDNTTNLQNAMSDAATKGYCLIIPIGTYKVSGILNIPTGLTMRGVSKALSIINFTSSTGQFRSDTDTNGHKICASIELSNFMVRGNYTSWSTPIDASSARAAFDISMFGHIHDIAVQNFECGIRTNQVINNPEYNEYNYKYGETKTFSNINIERCGCGFICNEYDVNINSLNVGWFHSMALIGSVTLNGLHAWGFFGAALYTGNKPMSNIEIESQLLTQGSATNLQPFIMLNGDCILTNVVLWNTPELSDYNAFSSAYIVGNTNATGVAQVRNLYIGHDVDTNDSSVLQRPIYDPKNMTLVVEGAVDKTITKFRTSGQSLPTNIGIRTGNGGYIMNMIGSTSIYCEDAANKAMKFTTESL